jgi:hypothetical protein
MWWHDRLLFLRFGLGAGKAKSKDHCSINTRAAGTECCKHSAQAFFAKGFTQKITDFLACGASIYGTMKIGGGGNRPLGVGFWVSPRRHAVV